MQNNEIQIDWLINRLASNVVTFESSPFCSMATRTNGVGKTSYISKVDGIAS